MKLLILFLNIFLFSNILFSQEKLSISVNICPILTNRSLITSDDYVSEYVTTNEYINGRNSMDYSLFGLKTGLDINTFLNDIFGFYLGFGYIYQKISHSYQFTPIEYNMGGNVIVYRPEFQSYIASYQYLSIPVGIILNINTSKKFIFNIHFGAALDFLIHKQDMDTYTGIYTYTSNSFVTELNLGLNCAYRFNSRLDLLLKPNINYSISSNLVDYSVIYQHNYYFGVEVGLKYIIRSY